MLGRINRNFVYFVAAIILYVYYYSQAYSPRLQSANLSSSDSGAVPESFDSAPRPTSSLAHDLDSPQQLESPPDALSEVFEEPKWYFQDDLLFSNPTFDILKLKRHAPHNYRGPGGFTFATYYGTRYSTAQDPYFQAAQQLAYRILWHPESRSEKYPLTVFVAPFIPEEQRDLLLAAGAIVRELDLVEGHTPIPGFGRWRDLFSKLHIWNQTDFERIAFLDVDVFPMQNLDEIFEVAEPQKCRPDLLPADDTNYAQDICDYDFSGVSVGAADQINVGVMVLSPNAAMHRRLMRESMRTENFDNTMAEQAFLNYAFRPDGPFPLSLIGREWNGFFPRASEIGWLKTIHEKLWSIERTGEADLQWLKDYFGESWAEMLALYSSKSFEDMRAADGPLSSR